MLMLVRFPIALLYFLVIALLGVIICLVRPFHPNNTALAAHMFAFGGIKILGIRLVVEGRDYLSQYSPCVYVANHQSNLDLFVFGSVVPDRTVTIGKKSLKYMPIFGQLYWFAGNVLIDRGNSVQAKKAMQAATRQLQEKNISLWVFAEGTRNKGNNMLPFKSGAFRTAIDSGLPIVPICASGYKTVLDLQRWNSGTVRIQVLPAIQTADLSQEDVAETMQLCWSMMKETIEQLDQKPN